MGRDPQKKATQMNQGKPQKHNKNKHRQKQQLKGQKTKKKKTGAESPRW